MPVLLRAVVTQARRRQREVVHGAQHLNSLLASTSAAPASTAAGVVRKVDRIKATAVPAYPSLARLEVHDHTLGVGYRDVRPRGRDVHPVVDQAGGELTAAGVVLN